MKLPVAGQLSFRIDGDDFKANGGETCCHLGRIALLPTADKP
jgi:hypothetical protein